MIFQIGVPCTFLRHAKTCVPEYTVVRDNFSPFSCSMHIPYNRQYGRQPGTKINCKTANSGFRLTSVLPVIRCDTDFAMQARFMSHNQAQRVISDTCPGACTYRLMLNSATLLKCQMWHCWRRKQKGRPFESKTYPKECDGWISINVV